MTDEQPQEITCPNCGGTLYQYLEANPEDAIPYREFGCENCDQTTYLPPAIYLEEPNCYE